MAENTKIEWCDHTFNPFIGCTKVSPACDNCYAEALSKRHEWAEWGNHPRRRTSESNWKQPLAWNRKAAKDGVRRKVFCASLADVFDNQVPIEWRTDLWRVIRETPHLDWLLLTKRPQNIAKMLPSPLGFEWLDWPWPNVWLGTTVENQEEADRRIPALLAVPAAVRFLSCEPLLGPLSIGKYLPGCYECGGECGWRSAAPPDIETCSSCGWEGEDAAEFCPNCGAQDFASVCPCCGSHANTGHPDTPNINWVICGGESGPNARPMHPDWARSLRDQCSAAGVPFFFKQWGEWAPGEAFGLITDGPITNGYGNVKNWMRRYVVREDRADRLDAHSFTEHATNLVYRVGKKAAGATLDGREWREFPHP